MKSWPMACAARLARSLRGPYDYFRAKFSRLVNASSVHFARHSVLQKVLKTRSAQHKLIGQRISILHGTSIHKGNQPVNFASIVQGHFVSVMFDMVLTLKRHRRCEWHTGQSSAS